MKLKHHVIPGTRYGGRTIIREIEKTARSPHRRVEVLCDCGDVGTSELRALIVGSGHHCASCAQTIVSYGSLEAKAEVEEAKETARKEKLEATKAATAQRKAERRAVVQSLKESGMTGNEIAAKLGIDKSYVSLILAGKR